MKQPRLHIVRPLRGGIQRVWRIPTQRVSNTGNVSQSLHCDIIVYTGKSSLAHARRKFENQVLSPRPNTTLAEWRRLLTHSGLNEMSVIFQTSS